MALFQALRRAGIPTERKPLCRPHPDYAGDGIPGTLTGCEADFVILLNGRPVAGFRRLSQDEAVLGSIHLPEPPEKELYRRLMDLRLFPLRSLILEGRLSGKYRMSRPALYSFQYWCYRNHIFIFHSPNIEGSASILEVIFRKLQLSTHEPDTRD
jgi:hypothetical protein